MILNRVVPKNLILELTDHDHAHLTFELAVEVFLLTALFCRHMSGSLSRRFLIPAIFLAVTAEFRHTCCVHFTVDGEGGLS